MDLTDILAWYSAAISTLVLICGGWVTIRNWFQKKVAAAAAASSSDTTSA